jgi:hypothetical protein
MKFILKTHITLEKKFSVEAVSLKEAMDLVQKQIYESEDLNSLEITHIGIDMNDPTIREYTGKIAREKLKAKLKEEQNNYIN